MEYMDKTIEIKNDKVIETMTQVTDLPKYIEAKKQEMKSAQELINIGMKKISNILDELSNLNK